MSIDVGYELDDGWFLFYSPTAATKYGSVNYLNDEGRVVATTYITRNEDGSGYNHDDITFVGRAVRYVGLTNP